MSNYHFIDSVIDGGELRHRFRCTAPEGAWCRRRPPGYDHDRESWTSDEATEPGHECWAVEWVQAAGVEDGVIGDDCTLASVAVNVSYDEAVWIAPAQETTR